MAKSGVASLQPAHLLIFAAMLLPTYSRLLLIELENDGSGRDGAVLGSQGVSPRGKTTLHGTTVITL